MAYGAGTSKAGLLIAGKDPYTTSDKIAPGLRSQYVPYFDLKTKQFPRAANGQLILVHWVDQAVALALGVFNGAHAADPELGNRLREVTRNNPAVLKTATEDAARVALKDLLDRKDIGVTDIEVDTSIRGRILTAVHYVNLRIYPQAKGLYRFVFQ